MLDNENTNHISTVRGQLLAQLATLKAAEPGDKLESEIKRSRGMAELSQTIINSAKVEVEYLAATGQQSSPLAFLTRRLLPNSTCCVTLAVSGHPK